ncbi:MGMT family protein [Ningiella sp. W23]|uniref:MGMT family protein n=1 Tax=Ningiella sp. W23 TaxID=3023715 RepID=UPI0037583FC3
MRPIEAASPKKYINIYKVVNLVPRGKVASYGQIADLAGLPGRARLVGKALGGLPQYESLHNTLSSSSEKHREHPRSVNWHRIVRSSGEIAFDKASEHARLQTGKLQEEGVAVFNNRVKMKDFQWQPDMHTLLHELSY